MQTETLIYEYTESGDDLLEAKVTHDEEDDIPYYVELREDWVNGKDLDRIIKTLQTMKRIRKTGSVR